MKIFRTALAFAFLTTATLVYADAPVPTPGGGVSCNPACGGISCGAKSCSVCNRDGCAVIPRNPKGGTN